MKKIYYAVFSFVAIIVISYFLYQRVINQSSYVGLSTVSCIDYTKPVVQRFSLTIGVYVLDKKYPLESNIGHDYGNCLHSIYVNDSSGKVFVESNDSDSLTLGQFFDVWRRAFTRDQIFEYKAGESHFLKVQVDGKFVSTYRDTLLKPNEKIVVIYK